MLSCVFALSPYVPRESVLVGSFCRLLSCVFVCQAIDPQPRHVRPVLGHVPPLPRSTPVGARACGGRAVAQRAQPRRGCVGVDGHGFGRDGFAVLVTSNRRRGAACNEYGVLQFHAATL